MKKEDFFILLAFVLLLLAMLYTVFYGGNRSRHGTGVSVPGTTPAFAVQSDEDDRSKNLAPPVLQM